MQQDRIDIEEKLRQLENQQLPDLSQMDEHWAGMKAALQTTPVKYSWKSKWFLLTGLLLLTGVVLLIVSNNNSAKQTEPVVSPTNLVAETKPDFEKTDPAATVAIIKVPANKIAGTSLPTKTVKNKEDKDQTDQTVLNLSVRLNPVDSTLKAANPDAQKMLNELLASLAKNEEYFLIDNSRDTVLFGAEGSSLYMPAKSLGGSNRVKISLKEFYKTSDIVMNKLSTTSNGEQLITGGMVHLSASVNDKPVDVLPGKTITWYLPDTSKQMEQMQLFTGEEKKGRVNWVSTEQWFSWPYNTTEVRVLNLSNEPIKTIEKRNGTVAVFAISEKPVLPQSELKSLLQEKYGYYKVRFRRQWKQDRWPVKVFYRTKVYGNAVGDSAWVKKETADKYKLESTQTRTMQGSTWRNLWGGSVLNVGSRRAKIGKTKAANTNVTGRLDTIMYDKWSESFEDGINKLQEKYSVDIRTLGWVNCDRFYNDSREKVNYYVNLQDSAVNYYTMIVFNKLRSMMAGYVVGDKVSFSNVPMGEAVKIISIGINKNGEAVMAMKEAKIGKETFTGLQFESTSASSIKSTLRKEDK